MAFIQIISLVLLVFSLNSDPISAIVFINSADYERRLCTRISDDFNTCRTVDLDEVDSIFRNESYGYITFPRISFNASPDSFIVRLKNGKDISKVKDFRMMAEKTEVDIEVSGPSIYNIECWSYGPLLKVSSNIMTSLPKSRSFKVLADEPDFRTYSELSILGRTQSGQFICYTQNETKSYSETFRIFTQSSEKNANADPLVPVQEFNKQIEDAGDSFIVPCRANFRMEGQPDLLWRKSEYDNLYALTAEEMKSFKWDPLVGFQFNRSNTRMWEMNILTCKIGSVKRQYLPTPTRFKTSIFVKAEGNKIGCGLGPRKNYNTRLLDSTAFYDKATYYACKTAYDCDLDLALGEHLRNSTELNAEENSFRTNILDLHKTSGIVSCVSKHGYNNKEVQVLETNSRVFFVGLDSKVYLLPGSYPNSAAIQISRVDRPDGVNQTEMSETTFSCTTHSFLRALGVYFVTRYEDMTEKKSLVRQSPNYPDQSVVSEYSIQLEANMTHLICLCYTQDGRRLSAESLLRAADYPTSVNNTTNSSDMLETSETLNNQGKAGSTQNATDKVGYALETGTSAAGPARSEITFGCFIEILIIGRCFIVNLL